MSTPQPESSSSAAFSSRTMKTKPRPIFPALEAVRHHRVSPSQPPTSNATTGLDFIRCAALHNALLTHCWTATGYDPLLLQRKTWWQTHHLDLDSLSRPLNPSLIEFLKLAWEVLPFPEEGCKAQNDFFYHIAHLTPPTGMDAMFAYTEHYDGLPAFGDLLTLYWTNPDIGGDLIDGIVYDQTTHLTCWSGGTGCFGDWGLNAFSLPWQPLESILSTCLDMIEDGKVIALHKSVVEEPDKFWVSEPDGSVVHKYFPEPTGPIFDPVWSGVKREGERYGSWVMVPWTEKDLEDSLAAWEDLLGAIEERMPSSSPSDPIAEYGLYDNNTLDEAQVPANHFAHAFFTRARKPRCSYLAPGLRLPKPEELISNPLKKAHLGAEVPLPRAPPGVTMTQSIINPIPILVGDTTVHSPWHHWQVPYLPDPQIPWGLFFDEVEPKRRFAYEDGVKLILPFTVGENGFVRLADGSTSVSNCDLFQLGWVPYGEMHSVQLKAVLSRFGEFVRSGVWRVGDYGVEEDEEKWREADTDLSGWRSESGERHPGYSTAMGPGVLY